VNEEEDSDSDFGDWDQDNWGISNRMRTQEKKMKSPATSSEVRNALCLHIQGVKVLKTACDVNI
jgi:hypothetical protein